MKAGRVVLVLGGARSGKSAFAQRLAGELGDGRAIFVATAQALDEEMAERIRRHRRDRPADWPTVEAPRQVAERLAAVWRDERAVLIDCLSLLVSNVILSLGEGAGLQGAEEAVERELDGLETLFRSRPASWVIVSNEVGLGVVPPYPAGRLFRDVLGRANQRMAARADEVWLLVAGLPLRLKPGATGPSAG
ncbi:MAG: bifunctional adenosylcobinamide kinase/adenosylcobinamide-phosphate guanylyltransferase [Bacillota bacterium]